MCGVSLPFSSPVSRCLIRRMFVGLRRARQQGSSHRVVGFALSPGSGRARPTNGREKAAQTKYHRDQRSSRQPADRYRGEVCATMWVMLGTPVTAVVDPAPPFFTRPVRRFLHLNDAGSGFAQRSRIAARGRSRAWEAPPTGLHSYVAHALQRAPRARSRRAGPITLAEVPRHQPQVPGVQIREAGPPASASISSFSRLTKVAGSSS